MKAGRLVSSRGSHTRAQNLRRPTGDSGYILVEVVVAAVMIGLMLASLGAAFAGAVEQARTMRSLVGTGTEAAGSDAGAAWEWGPRVVAAWWTPGPALHARISGTPDASGKARYVGVWVDGWLVRESLVAGDGAEGAAVTAELVVPTQTWSGLVGRELVIRARNADGPWGPPWRLAVAGPAGGDPALGSPHVSPLPGPTAVAHRPGAGASSLQVSWRSGSVSAPPFGLLFVLDPAVLGWGGVTLDSRSQWWWIQDGRSVDLYF